MSEPVLPPMTPEEKRLARKMAKVIEAVLRDYQRQHPVRGGLITPPCHCRCHSDPYPIPATLLSKSDPEVTRND